MKQSDQFGVLRYFRFISLCVIVIITFFFSACKKEEKAPPSPPPAVTVLEVVRKDVPVVAEYVAQTQSSRLVNIHARVNGFLDKRMYTEGALVKQGQVLFQMDPKPFKAQLDQAKAALARQEASLETARLNLARVKPLTELNALSQKDLDDATGRFQSASAAVEQAKAQVETARLNLSYTTITSPVTGVSSFARQADGTYINQLNSLLTTVAVLSPMWVNFSLSENDMQRNRDQVARGLLRYPKDEKFIVEVVLVDGSVHPHLGQITFAEPSYNAQTGTFLIRASVNNPDGVLRPNQYVRARLKGAVRPNAILVPQRAVQQGSKGHFVWVVDKENKIEQRPVVVGDWQGDNWFIFEGLKSGEKVVTDGALGLHPGMVVTSKPYSGGQEPAKEQAKEPGKEPAKETTREPAKAAATKEPAKEPPKVSAKAPVKESPKEPVKASAKEPAKVPVKATVTKESEKEPAKVSPKMPVNKEPAKAPAKEPGKVPMKTGSVSPKTEAVKDGK